MDCCLWTINNNSKKIIDTMKTQYYGKVNTFDTGFSSFAKKNLDVESRFCSAFGLTKPSTFTLRNDFFMCPPFHSYKILDEYDKNNIVIKERKYFYGDETHDGVGYEQYHDITFRSNGKYEIRIENLQTNKIQTYIFTIY